MALGTDWPTMSPSVTANLLMPYVLRPSVYACWAALRTFFIFARKSMVRRSPLSCRISSGDMKGFLLSKGMRSYAMRSPGVMIVGTSASTLRRFSKTPIAPERVE